jgi:hypothetical protein
VTRWYAHWDTNGWVRLSSPKAHFTAWINHTEPDRDQSTGGLSTADKRLATGLELVAKAAELDAADAQNQHRLRAIGGRK